MDIYEIEKNNFSNLHSSFHKLLNSLKKNKISNDKKLKLIEINHYIDILGSKIIEFNESSCKKNKKKIKRD